MTTHPPEPDPSSERAASWPRRHPWLTALLWLVTVWYLFGLFYRTPIPNPWAEKTFVIKGRFPFDKGYDLLFKINATGQARWHQRLCGNIQTERAICTGGGVFVRPTRIDGQHYEMVLHEDFYFKGPQQWEMQYWELVYDPAFGVPPESYVLTTHGLMPHVVCNDSMASRKKVRGKLFCSSQYDDKERKQGIVKYRNIYLPLSAEAKPGEKVVDYWLHSELDALLPP